MESFKTDLCVIGAGAAGLSVAAGAVQFGASVVLIESHQMGGDCLNVGCVPSKALLYASKDIKLGHKKVAHNFSEAMQYVRHVIREIAPHDSPERFEGLGVKVLQGTAKFVDSKTIQVNNQTIQAKYFIVATGSRPLVPEIPGLKSIPYLTNETIFQLIEQPEHLIILGAGPIGCELANAFINLGSKVSLITRSTVLPKDEPEHRNILKDYLAEQGVAIYEGTQVSKISATETRYDCHIQADGIISGSHVLVATGREAVTDTLNLAAGKVTFDEKGICVNECLRSKSNPRVYALGDVASEAKFTHMASYQAGIVIKNCLFRLRAKAKPKAVPWVTYTDLEVAHVGLTEQMAKAQNLSCKVFQVPYYTNDRAQTDQQLQGSIKLVVTSKGKVLGVGICGMQAGELLTPWIVALQNNLGLKAMVDSIIPYPTLSELHKKISSEFYRSWVLFKWSRGLVKLLL